MDITVNRLSKYFGTGAARRMVLSDVSLHIDRGEMVALIGASGAGKSTLMRHLAGLLPADTGAVCVGGRWVLQNGCLARDIRSVRAGMAIIFQQFNLVSRLSVHTNVLAGLLSHRPWWRTWFFNFSRADHHAASVALERVGLGDRAAQRASTLSGGQQQRAAIARALVQGAGVVLGDEPIASLDPRSARRVMEHLARINREDGVTCLISLHQFDYALDFCPRTIALAGGRIVYDGPTAALSATQLSEIYGGSPSATPSPAQPTPVSASAPGEAIPLPV
ncbi:MAG: phosphonate transporter ATP-binding protein [Verrucomicrobiota bacterium]|jgi:phosphonate transport system ATP-binding protein